MRPLAIPQPSSPIMFGAPAPPGELLPWSWAEQRTGRVETDPSSLQAMCDAYSPKYDYPITPADSGIYDTSGLGGPAQLVTPRVVFGWDQHMNSPTRWTFTD